MAHCHRELLHAQWRILLDDEFMAAYEHGIVVACFDGLTRRFYPRIFTYSADYPEKSVCFECQGISNRFLFIEGHSWPVFGIWEVVHVLDVSYRWTRPEM